MSTVTKLDNILQTKEGLKSVITDFGGTVPDKFKDYPNAIREAYTQSDSSFKANAEHTLSGTVIIPSGLTILKNYYLYGNNNVTRFELPDTITSIGAYQFYECTKLTSVRLPKNDQFKVLTDYFCSKCTSLTDLNNIENLEGITTFGSSVFYNCTNLLRAHLPSTLITLGTYTFYGCSKLEDVTLLEGITTIGNSAFYGCTNLHNITLPSTLTTMGTAVFQLSGIYKLEIPEGIKKIPNNTVYQCASLEEIILPSTVTNINTGALRQCTSLERVIVKATTPPTLAADAFRDVKMNGIIYVPQGCKAAYEATVWNNSTANYYPKSRGWTIEELDADGNIPA